MMMARRYKSYAAETGTAYQYFFAGSRIVNRPEGQGQGSDYLFVVTADQGPPFVLRVFISERAAQAWRHDRGTELASNEMYALAKMRLFRAFDEIEVLRNEGLNLLVDEGNLAEMLAPLGL
jgi:hypothetical protein